MLPHADEAFDRDMEITGVCAQASAGMLLLTKC